MKGIKAVKMGLVGAAAGLALIGGLILVMQVSAASGTLTVGDGSAAPGGSGDVTLVANVGEPGLGAWTVDIQYDADVVTAVNCEEDNGSVCNAEFAADMVRVTGASASGEEGETVLATITFECADAEGESPLTLIVGDEDHPFADATVGDPQPIDGTYVDGTFSCAESTATPVAAAATATAVPVSGGPNTGTGGPSDSTSFSWVVLAIAALGLAGVAGYGALRVRSH